MRGRTLKSGPVNVGSAVIAIVAAMWFAGPADAARVEGHGRAHHHSGVAGARGGGPRAEYVTRGNAPRFLASRSTNFLATRSTRVLAAPHQLAPKTTVTFVPGAVVRPRHCGATQCDPQDCGSQNCGQNGGSQRCDRSDDAGIHENQMNVQSQDVTRAPDAANRSTTNDYSPKRSPVFRVIRTGRP
jgi:hypothetical protein